MEKRGCFVTLHANGRLRGCIGTIEPIKSLIDGVKENAIHAGFQDPRFPPVTLNEMENITIEISILTKPVPLRFENADDVEKTAETRCAWRNPFTGLLPGDFSSAGLETASRNRRLSGAFMPESRNGENMLEGH